MAAVMAVRATMATVPITAVKAIRPVRARTATRLPPGRKPLRGSQAASEMLHSCSARASRAVTLAIARRVNATGRGLDGEGRTAGVRRYGDRGSPGRQFSGEARQ